MRTGLALAFVMTFTVLGAAQSATTQARYAAQKVAEQTVVLTVRGMT
jgi:Tfp pilus assembly protein PilX